jgi:iron complex transport system ATP-binding protein
MQAAVQDSAITIFDEPIANVDIARSQTLFDALLRDAIFKNKIVITHDLHFAFSLGFDVLYLKSGEIEFFGESGEFFGELSLKKRFGERIVKSLNGVYTNYAKI